MKQLTSIALIGSSLLFSACLDRNRGGDPDTAEAAVDSSDHAETEGNLMMAAIDGADMTSASALTSDEAAVRIAANVALRWNPSGCAIVGQTGRNISITYNDCTGPRGLLHVSGRLELTVTVSPTGVIGVHGTSDELRINRAVLQLDSEATYTVRSTGHELGVRTIGTGTGPRGNAVEHEGDYTITWDTASQCGRIAGSWSTSIGDTSRSNDVDVRRCADGCPTGAITHRFRAGASLTITFDGTSTAAFSASTGATGTIALACGR